MIFTEVAFPLIGGLGLFLYGMKTMSEGLQRMAGNRLRRILETVSANRVAACLTGALITGLIQSSSATTVMLVGFVNAGLLNFSQALGVILGANIGTTITAQLIAFKITDWALPAIAVGSFMRLFAKRRRYMDYGAVILGFGLLFFGMATMKTGVAPIKDSPAFIDFFTRFQGDVFSGRLLCVMVGAFLTMALQSSSATVGLTMTLATQGLIGFPGAVALTLGDNIGTTITAELASIGTSPAAHRTARANTLFNIFGVTYMVLLFPFFLDLVTWVSANLLQMGPPEMVVGDERPNVARYIATAHTMFNVVNALFFLVFLKFLLKAAYWLTPTKAEAEEDIDLFKTKYLDKSFLDVSSVALEQARQEIIRMGEIAGESMSTVFNAMPERKLKALGQWRHREDAIDVLQREIMDYLVQISQSDITLEDSKQISSLMRMTNNIERIGDSIENIAELIEEMIENDLDLAEEGTDDFNQIAEKVVEFYGFILDCLKRPREDSIMGKAREMEDGVDELREVMRTKYIMRLRDGTCTIDPGIIFTDMLSNFEKIGDYCFNIAQSLAGIK